jgi:hypothetical protein
MRSPGTRPLGRSAPIPRLALAAWAVLMAAPCPGADLPIDREPINSMTAPANDPVARLRGRIERGEATLEFEVNGRGYLRSVLEQLGVSPASQALVFSKTSFQVARISPRTPRALYFGEDAYVGWVQGGESLEISAVDPQLGATFYLLDQRPAEKPEFRQQTHNCLLCHASPKTEDVPGHLLRSVFPSRTGLPVFRVGTFQTDQSSPLDQRWGGWYVTGTHGDQRHMGNVVVTDRDDPRKLDAGAGANRVDLAGLVDTRPYLTGHSDIAALMVLDHQAPMHNLIAAASYQARLALHQEAEINKALGRPAGSISEGTGRRIASHAERLVSYLLFSGEAALTAPIEGTSGFAGEFARGGPRDRRGRSLRDLDLSRRLFKYPCSYLIYSEAFEGLPAPMKAEVYRRLREILDGPEAGPRYAHLSPEDRRAIHEILRDTKPDLPDYWREARR